MFRIEFGMQTFYVHGIYLNKMKYVRQSSVAHFVHKVNSYWKINYNKIIKLCPFLQWMTRIKQL